jgi:DNA-binding XRE family transcriptional regulator
MDADHEGRMIDPEAITEARKALGRQLAAYREAAGLIQEQLAPLIHYGRSTIANAETGYSICSRTFWERCDKALNADGALLRGYEEFNALTRQQRAEIAQRMEAERSAKYRQLQDQQGQSDRWSAPDQAVTVDDMKRRTAMALPVLAFASAMTGPVEPWQRLAHALDHPSQLDDQAVEYLEWYTLDFFRREEHTPARQLAADLQAHIERLEHLLRGARDDYLIRLLMTTGEALALAGWLAFDCKEHMRADDLYGRAVYAARKAGDGPLAACTLAYRSYMAEAAGDIGSARELLTEAQTYVRGEHSAATRSWLAAREAEVDATLGDETSALRALDRAMAAYDYAHPHRERPWTGFFTPTRLGSMAVTTYARLDHAELDATTDSVVASLPATDAKIKAVILSDVATAAIKRGRHDRGAQLGHDALNATLAQEASLGRQRLHELHLMIHDKRDISALAELDDRLVAHVA